jgi:transposase InsO family protein
VFSRRVVGWAMETHLHTELVLAALNLALGQRRPADVIHHSDQGTQYTSIAFGTRCQQAGMRPSMGSGDGFDNATAESFLPPWNVNCSIAAVSKLRLRHTWRSLTSSRAGTIPIVATPRSAISRRSITNVTMEMMPTNLAVRGQRGAQRRGRRSKTFKLSSPTLRSGEGWGRKSWTQNNTNAKSRRLLRNISKPKPKPIHRNG